MKKLIFTLIGTIALISAAFAGTESYAGKDKVVQQAAPFCDWYADREWNVSVWGTYAFTGTEDSERVDPTLYERGDLPHNTPNIGYLETDHAWGGGIDAKYFFHRYFGLGIEGWVVDAGRGFVDFKGRDEIQISTGQESRAVGSVLGTFTLRYPIHCSRFAPYVWAGGGAIFGGGQRERVNVTGLSFPIISTDHLGSTTELIGQFGGGFEIRLTQRIGLINDFSWNVVDGPKNNFGMARTGINFAF